MNICCRCALVCVALFSMGGCASLGNLFALPNEDSEMIIEAPQSTPEVAPKADTGIKYRPEQRDLQQPRAEGAGMWVYRAPNTLYQPSFSHKSLSDYAEQLTMELVKNGQQLTTQSRIGIASFVTLDSSLNQTSAVGNQLAEMMIAEIQSFGVPVVDFKTMDHIWVNSKGDTVFTREGAKLAAGFAIDYVLTGTLIHSEKGVKVNARIIEFSSKIVMSSASIAIPHFVVQSVQPNMVFVGE